MLHMLKWLYMYVASVCSRCFFCFLDVCCKHVYLDVVYVSHIYCNCFIWMLHMFCNGFSSGFRVFSSVSDTRFKCFICLQMYVANVSYGCFKSRLSVAHVTMTPVTDGQRPAIGLQLLPCAFLTRRASPSPLLSSPSLTFPPSHYSISNSCG
jgi:hypothetical protein